MFILLLHYKQPIEEVIKNLEAHRVFLDKYYDQGKFILSGPRIPRTGGCILCHAASKEEVKESIKEDPFYFNRIADYEIIEVEINKQAPGFEKFIR